jgi:hypothetical protein
MPANDLLGMWLNSSQAGTIATQEGVCTAAFYAIAVSAVARVMHSACHTGVYCHALTCV